MDSTGTMTRLAITPKRHHIYFVAAVIALAFFTFISLLIRPARAESSVRAADEHIITLHDDGIEKGFITKAKTLRDALKAENIPVDTNDRTEPGLDEPLIAPSYEVNIYRARVVVVRDGASETKIISAYRTGKQIAAQIGIPIRDEDKVVLSQSMDIVSDGAAEILTITHAKMVNFEFYGKKTIAYTLEPTVGDMLRAKGITMEANDGVAPAKSTGISEGMTVRLWRDGVQTITVDEDVPFETEQIKDANRDRGYKEVKTAGVAGRRTVSYEINTQNGVEVSRREINSTVIKQPVKQVEVIGVKVPYANGLSKSKGVVYFTDSNGVVHRETYYDLPMNVVMGNCGAGGKYTVREDGVKVDAGGYIIVAANLVRYPRCSVVETSLGPGKVYDTGGFAAVHPDGFDLATDWSNNNGI